MPTSPSTMNILIIEDEQNVAAFMQKGLEEAGHQTRLATNGITGLDQALNGGFDLIILDLVLPGMDGIEVCRRIRKSEGAPLPVLMLTALGTTDDVVRGLNAGADDYLVKPFQFRELLARISAIARRVGKDAQLVPILTLGDLHLDPDAKRVVRGDQEIRLTAREFALLTFLLQNKGKVISREKILEEVWDIHFNTNTNVVDVYVNYLRKKVDKGFDRKYIHTAVGMGYVLKEDPPDA